MMMIRFVTQSMGGNSVKDSPGFGAVIWIVFGISACATLLLTLTVRLFFRRGKRAVEP
jgi:hypothetical protein